MRCRSLLLPSLLATSTSACGQLTGPYRLVISPRCTWQCRRGQCTVPLTSASQCSSLMDEVASFEAEGELLELRLEAARLTRPRQTNGQSTAPAHANTSTESHVIPACPSPIAAPESTRLFRAPDSQPSSLAHTLPQPITGGRWTRRPQDRRHLFTHGDPDYARNTVAYLHAAIPLPFSMLVQKLSACHHDALLAMLEYVARCRSVETALVPTRADWCRVERACWTALVAPIADESAEPSGDGITSKHLACLSRFVSVSLPASTGPAALPFLLLCYRHRRALRRVQNVQVLDALLRVAPPDSFAFSDAQLAALAKEVHEAVLTHVVWRCVTLADKEFDPPHGTGHSAAPLSPSRPTTFMGGFNVAQLVERALIFHLDAIHPTVQKAACLWVLNHTARPLSTTISSPRPVSTYEKVVQEPLLGPRPKTPEEKEARRKAARADFDALRQLVKATKQFTAHTVDHSLEKTSSTAGPLLCDSLVAEMARTPCAAPAETLTTTTTIGSAPYTFEEDVAMTRLWHALQRLQKSDGETRRALLEEAHTSLLHVTTPLRICHALSWDALVRVPMLAGVAVLQAVLAVPYWEESDDHASAQEVGTQLFAAISSNMAHAESLALLQTAIATLPHWQARLSPSAVFDAWREKLSYLVPASLATVVLSQLAQDRALAAFQLPKCAIGLVRALVCRVPVPESPVDDGGALGLVLEQLMEQDLQQASLSSADDAPDQLTVANLVRDMAEARAMASESASGTRGHMTWGDVLEARDRPALTATERQAIAQGWATLNRLDHLTRSLSEEVQLWQTVSHGRFHCRDCCRQTVLWAEATTARRHPAVSAGTITLAEPVCAHVASRGYVRDLLQRVNGRILSRYVTQLIATTRDDRCASDAQAARLTQLLATLERTLHTPAHPYVPALLTYSLLLACGLQPRITRAMPESFTRDTLGQADQQPGTWVVLLESPTEPVTRGSLRSLMELFRSDAETCAEEGRVAHELTVLLLDVMRVVRECFVALKDTHVSGASSGSRATASVLWRAAEAQLWCTLATLHIIATLPLLPASTSQPSLTCSLVPCLYRDAITTLTHLAEQAALRHEHESAMPVLSVAKALPPGVKLRDIFTPTLHQRVFDVACLHMDVHETAALCALALAASQVASLGIAPVPRTVVQTVVRRCVVTGVPVPAEVRTASLEGRTGDHA